MEFIITNFEGNDKIMHKIANKNKKPVAVLSSAAIGVLIAAAVSTNAQAAVKSYVVQNGDKYISFDMNTLLQDYTNKLIGQPSPSYDAYLDTLSTEPGLVAFEDDVKGYVSADAVETAYANALAIGDKAFDVDNFTENAAEENINKDLKVGYEWKDGKIVPVENGIEVSSVSAINATTLQIVLADKPETDPTADKFTVTVNGAAVASPTAVTKVDSDLTGKTYRLTIATLNGQQGDVAVNGIKAVVPTGKFYAFDYAAPTLQSITTEGTDTLELQFSEKLDSATVELGGNFAVSSVVGGINNAIVKTALDSTGTKVTVTLTDPLTVADYVVTLGTTGLTNTVKDIAGNAIYAGTQVGFRPTDAQLQNKVAPSLVSAVYNKVQGKLTLKYNKNIQDSTLDTTKLSINGVVFTGNDINTDVNADDDTVIITLSDDTKTAVNALTGNLTLTSAKDAYGDGTVSTNGETFAVSSQQPAIVKSAAYDQQSNKLTVTFDQPVSLKTDNVLSIDDTDESSSAVVTKSMAIDADGTPADTTVANTTWTFDCSKDTNIAAAIEALAPASLKVYIGAGAVTNGASIDNVAGQDTYANGVNVTYTADTTKPTLAGVEYNNNTGNLVLTFSEKIDAATANANKANIKLLEADGTPLVGLESLSADTASELGSTKTLTYGLSVDEKTALETAINEGKTVKAIIDETVVKDEANLKADATTYATGATVTYKDYVAPGLAQFTSPSVHYVDVSNANLISVKFNEPVDSNTASNVNNYIITDSTGAKLAVTKVIPQAVDTSNGTETVLITTASQTAGAPYTLTINNVKDIAGNVITTPIVKPFDGSATADTAKLTVDSLVVSAPANSKNDTLTIGFNTAPDTTKALDLSNYVVLQADTDDTTGWANASQISLTNSKTSLVSGDATKVRITLDAPNLQNGKFYKVVVSNLTTVTGQALGTATGDTDAKSAALAAVAPDAPAITESQTPTGAGSVKLVFNEELTGADVAANYSVAQASTTVTKATYNWDATAGKATVTLDLSKPLTDISDVTLTNASGVTNVKNLAGVSFASPIIHAPATVGDTVAPTVKTVVAKADPDAGNDVITVKFNDNDIFGTSVVAKDIVVKDAQGTVIPASDYTVVFDGTSDPDTITVTFDKTGDNAYNLKNGDNYTVTITGVVDLSGNALADTTATATWDPATDTAAPEIASDGLALTTGTAGHGNIAVTFNEDVDAATATNKANYAVKTGSTTLTPSYVTYDTASKTATVYFAEELTNAAYDVIVTNVKDLAGNVTTGSTQSLDATISDISLAGVAIDVAAGNITGTTTDMEYSLNSTDGTDGDWTACTDTDTSVSFAEGKVYVRQANKTTNNSLVATVAAPAVAPSVTSDDSANTVSGIDGTMEFSTDGGSSWTSYDAGAPNLPDLTGTVTLQVRVKATANELPSEVKSLDFTS